MPPSLHLGSSGEGSVPGIRTRVLASVVDLGVIWGWLGFLAGVSALVRRAVGSRPASDRQPPLAAVDAAVFVGTVLPVAGYFVATEGGARQASVGKRLSGLSLEAAPGGGPLGRLRLVARTSVKLAPWQLAHLYVTRMITKRGSPVVAWGAYALSLALAVVDVVVAVRDPQQRALHDRIAGSRVVPVDPQRR